MARENRERPTMNPLKKIKMLMRRVQSQNQVIATLEQQNYDLVVKLNDTNLSLSSLTDEYNKLISKNYEQAVQLNHHHQELIKLINTCDSGILTALKSVGNLSEGLLNLKNNISQSKLDTSELKTFTSAFTSTSVSTSTNVSFQALPQDTKKNQAAVSPMVRGYTIGHPTITLQRLRLTPNDQSIINREENSPSESIRMRSGLSPIEEEQPLPRPVRTRLGNRTVPPLYSGTNSRLSDFIPEAHAEPVVRLSDVSRLLSNTAWLNMNISPRNENAAETSSLDESPSPISSPTDEDVNVTNAPTITVRRRKNIRKSTSISNTDRNERGGETSQNTSANNRSRICTEENMVVNKTREENLKEVTSFVENQEETSSTIINSSPIPIPSDFNAENGITTIAGNNNECFIENTDVNLSSELDVAEPVLAVTPVPGPSSSQTDAENENSNRRQSSRIKNPPLRYLRKKPSLKSGGEKENSRSRSKSNQNSNKTSRRSHVTHNISTSRKRSIVDASNEETSSKHSSSTLSEKRTSARNKKPIKYVDEPLTNAEMNKILKKGLTTKNKKQRKKEKDKN